MKQKMTKTYNTERKLFFVGVSSIMVLVGAYIYFVSAAVAHVVVRKELSQEINKIQTHISDLESEYIIAKDAVGASSADVRGFQKNEEKVFVTKVSSNVVLSLYNERE